MISAERPGGRWGVVGAALASLAILVSCGPESAPPTPVVQPPVLELVAEPDWPVLDDDLGAESLASACSASIQYFEHLPLDATFAFGEFEWGRSQLEDGIRRACSLILDEQDPERRASALKAEFMLLRSTGRDGRGEVLMTGYFEPEVAASHSPTDEFRFPVLGVPDDLVTVDLEAFGADPSFGPIIGRVEGDRLTPYPDRRAIDFGRGLEASAPVLGYLRNPIDLFFLQVQGSGMLVFADGERVRAGFAAANGHPYRSIGRLLIDENRISVEAMSMQAIRDYLSDHPGEVERVLAYNPSYVFFRRLEAHGGPLGCFGIPVIAGRSIATDRRLFQAPALAFIDGEIPTREGETRRFSRFAFNHDTGSSIRGPGRLDLYVGAATSAGEIAGRMKHIGRLYFLFPKVS